MRTDFADSFDEHGFTTVRDWFQLAMARKVNDPMAMPHGITLNLGAGYRKIGDSIPVDLEHGWDADKGSYIFVPSEPGGQCKIMAMADSVSGIWAHGFFEHIEDPIKMLWECQRVLQVGGVLNVVVPHGMAELAWEDLTHKHSFQEGTWKNLFDNPYYASGLEDRWELKVHTCFIMGVVWRNLSLFTQLIKNTDGKHYWEEAE